MKLNWKEIANQTDPKDIADITAGTTALAAYLSYLPEVAAGLTIVWALIRIYEWARYRIFGKRDEDSRGFKL